MKNELDIREELIAKRSQIKSFDDLVAFLKDVKDNYNPDINSLSEEEQEMWYGGVVRAAAQAAIATSEFFEEEIGLTGFQHHFMVNDMMFGWGYSGCKTGLRILNWDDMLRPDGGLSVNKTISKKTWEKIQEEAKKRLEELNEQDKNESIIKLMNHLQSIVDGTVPFGYEVKED